MGRSAQRLGGAEAAGGAFLPELLGASLLEVRDMHAAHLVKILALEEESRAKGSGLGAPDINRRLAEAKEEAAAAVFEALKQKTATEVGRQKGAKPEKTETRLDVRALLAGLGGGAGGAVGAGKSPVKTFQDDIDELVASLQVQLATFQQSAGQVQLYELSLRGATDALLAEARSPIERLPLKERDWEATEAQTRALDMSWNKTRVFLAPVDDLTRAHIEYMQTLDELSGWLF